jgi:hypothetical protein
MRVDDLRSAHAIPALSQGVDTWDRQALLGLCFAVCVPGASITICASGLDICAIGPCSRYGEPEV